MIDFDRLRRFVARGQAAQRAVDQILAPEPEHVARIHFTGTETLLFCLKATVSSAGNTLLHTDDWARVTCMACKNRLASQRWLAQLKTDPAATEETELRSTA